MSIVANRPPFTIADWRAAAQEKRQQLDESIPASFCLPEALLQQVHSEHGPYSERPTLLDSGILTKLDIEITSIVNVPVLLKRIATKRYSAVQVAEAFCKRASLAQQFTSCLTELWYDAAIKRARWLDDYQRREGRVIGILHGLPVSLKDCFDVEGANSNAGLVSWLPYRASKNSCVAQALLNAGAVLYAKTSSSQALLSVESINNIFGTVKNPHNTELSAGGSSGGEGALVAAGGSILGSGTDGGGSLRWPAAFCGLWTLKPSKERVPGAGISAPRSGSESVNAGIGPLAKTVSGLELWMQAQLASEPWNYTFGCLPMKWDTVQAQRPSATKLKVGVVWDDGIIKPTPPVTRALQIVVEALSKAGHTIVSLPKERIFPLHRRSLGCTMLSNVQDGGRTVMRHINASGEPVVPRTAVGSAASALTAEQVFDNHLLRGQLASEYNDIWIEFGLDTILAPATAHPANPHGKYISNSYATVYNMLDYVAGAVPVTFVDQELDVADRDWYDGEIYERVEPDRFPYDLGDREMKSLYTSPAVFKDAPVGVQFLCRRLREEKCIGILKEVEQLLAEKTG
ncbi:hypothetical protein A1O1_04559 [Capronia coronata CBS 617.96]|uniref:amidase n=1 Tax=Capronia coronata CBS 617.96 TaxID=1182541 RepID=W9YEZ9_9EURO|nr:uncharacterized protein A1O1_04559 [Capronia coronata CBS 617.96]EXJ91447.1 hypothetical protein A1O1_04559 [Capronia coronata CBS 617.96]